MAASQSRRLEYLDTRKSTGRTQLDGTRDLVDEGEITVYVVENLDFASRLARHRHILE